MRIFLLRARSLIRFIKWLTFVCVLFLLYVFGQLLQMNYLPSSSLLSFSPSSLTSSLLLQEQTRIHLPYFRNHLHQQLQRVLQLYSINTSTQLSTNNNLRFTNQIFTNRPDKNVDAAPEWLKDAVQLSTNFSTFEIPILWRSLLLLLNERPIVQNPHLLHFSSHPFSEPFKNVILVQVHDRSAYLNVTINSLRNVQDIDSSLVIFSHDLIDPTINEIVQNIDFCAVIQIFYPYSNQLYPNTFPGNSLNDCDRNILPEQAKLIGCNSANYPDKYGHYREATVVQIKHHFVWKLQFVFEQLEWTRNFAGSVLLLEDDHFVAPDTLIVLNKTKELVKTKTISLITLGSYLNSINYVHFGNKVSLQLWVASKHNIGMVIDQKFWKIFNKMSSCFCHYDDYNWDWSLHFSEFCKKKYLLTLVLSAARIFHIGTCGVHHQKKHCDIQNKIKQINRMMLYANSFLFPRRMIWFGPHRSTSLFLPKPNGGFADPRDVDLCLRLFKGKKLEIHFNLTSDNVHHLNS